MRSVGSLRASASLSALVLALALALALSPASAQRAGTQQGDGPVVDATLDAMRGGQRSLAAERGRRVIVLFYEDRPHVEDNDVLKGELNRFLRDNHLEERLVLYGVANLADVGAVPQAFVREMIRPLVDRWNADILLDWNGVMRRAPFDFPTAAAVVAIVDREGHIVFRHTGRVGDPERRAFYRALRGALAP
ncbi:MAG: hypothetical protein M3Y87_14540 [Myxococcota bacterium]|nr:hypothetical protein [Myxococcota bacterium]